MPPTPTPVRPGGVLTAKQEWSLNMLTCAAWFVICLGLQGYNVTPLSRGNFMLRSLATLLSLLKDDELIPISLFTSVVFVYHFYGKNMRIILMIGSRIPNESNFNDFKRKARRLNGFM